MIIKYCKKFRIMALSPILTTSVCMLFAYIGKRVSNDIKKFEEWIFIIIDFYLNYLKHLKYF